MLVHKGNACLLAHAAHHPEGMHSVLAGDIRVDGREILEAGWFTRDDLPERIPSSISIARGLIDRFYARCGSAR